MKTVLFIIAVVAVIFGIIAYIGSRESDPKERAKEAAAGAAGGAVMAGSCLLQIIVSGLIALAGIWLIAKIFF